MNDDKVWTILFPIMSLGYLITSVLAYRKDEMLLFILFMFLFVAFLGAGIHLIRRTRGK